MKTSTIVNSLKIVSEKNTVTVTDGESNGSNKPYLVIENSLTPNEVHIYSEEGLFKISKPEYVKLKSMMMLLKLVS